MHPHKGDLSSPIEMYAVQSNGFKIVAFLKDPVNIQGQIELNTSLCTPQIDLFL